MDTRSIKTLTGVHPQLCALAVVAQKRMESRDDGLSFIVTEGLRSKERQAQLVKSGASQTMNSKHLEGLAFDVAATVNGEVRWDWPLYPKVAEVIKSVARDLGLKITWGGDWKTLRDGPHYQLEV